MASAPKAFIEKISTTRMESKQIIFFMVSLLCPTKKPRFSVMK